MSLSRGKRVTALWLKELFVLIVTYQYLALNPWVEIQIQNQNPKIKRRKKETKSKKTFIYST